MLILMAHLNSQILHPPPWMQNLASVLCEREATAATGRLIVGPINLQTGIMAEQECTDGAVADEENIAG